MILSFAIGFFIGASLLFSALFLQFRGWSADAWLSADYWIVVQCVLGGAVLVAHQVYNTATSRHAAALLAESQKLSWLNSKRRAFAGGMFSGLVGPMLLVLLFIAILATYGWIAEGHPLSLFR